LTRTFDARGRLLELRDRRGLCQQFRWDNLDRLVERHCPGGITEQFTYDTQRRLHEQVVRARDGRLARTHRYDARGNLAVLEDHREGLLHFVYDPLNRLTAIRRQCSVGALGTGDEAYDYDANHAMRATHRGVRRMTPDGKVLQEGIREIHYGEDGAVALVRWGQSTRALKHDINSRLVEVTQADGTTVRYEYDPFGRRTAKVIGEERTEFLWEGWTLAAELKEAAVVNAYASENLRPLAQWTRGFRLTPVLDNRAVVREVFDEFGELRWCCTLDAYGNLLWEKGDAPSPSRLQGQYYDAETGLHYNFHRHYDPCLGDYTAPDPIGVEGGCHFYAYPRNPFRWNDPFGLSCPDHKDDKPQDPNEPKKDANSSKPQEATAALEDRPKNTSPGTPDASERVNGLIDKGTIVIHGDDDFQAGVRSDLETIAATGTGEGLLQRIERGFDNDDRNVVRIGKQKDGLGPNGTPDGLGAYADLGKGGGAPTDIKYQPGNDDPLGLGWKGSPSDAQLTHELGHAANNSEGTNRSLTVLQNDPQGCPNAEEKQVLAIERAYRNEKKYPDRPRYNESP
jgi:RHS repeat-associated protein